MRDHRLFDHTDWKSKKKICKSSDVPVFTENIGGEQNQRVFVVRDEAPHFFRGPRLLYWEFCFTLLQPAY